MLFIRTFFVCSFKIFGKFSGSYKDAIHTHNDDDTITICLSVTEKNILRKKRIKFIISLFFKNRKAAIM